MCMLGKGLRRDQKKVGDPAPGAKARRGSRASPRWDMESSAPAQSREEPPLDPSATLHAAGPARCERSRTEPCRARACRGAEWSEVEGRSCMRFLPTVHGLLLLPAPFTFTFTSIPPHYSLRSNSVVNCSHVGRPRLPGSGISHLVHGPAAVPEGRRLSPSRHRKCQNLPPPPRRRRQPTL